MRACPESERCLALERSRRAVSLRSGLDSTAPKPANARIFHCIESWLTRPSLRLHDGPIRAAPAIPAGGPQLPAHQPDSAPVGDAAHGLVQPHRAAAGEPSIDRPV